MASKHFPSLAAAAFAALLFHFFLKRRSREINRGKANDDAAANEGTAGGASRAHTSTESHEMATSSGPAKDAAANDGTAGDDSGAHTSTGVPEMPTSTGYDYEVFLSFRGPDTGAGFSDYLYTSLNSAGIRTFKDDEDLRVGEEFPPELLQAIKQLKISIPIFSKGYASSVWCLQELAQMVECQKTGRQKIIPIFYDVAPSEVRHQNGGYGEAFLSHEKKGRYDKKTIEEWKAALSAVGEINGYDLQSMPNRRDGEFVKKVTLEVFNELKKASPLAVSDYFVDVDNHVDAIMEKIGVGTSETRIIGIHGMGGIGKTTIAKIIYNRLSEDFEGCCFLSNIREMSERKGIECLQKQLISDILKNKCPDVTSIDDGIETIKDRLSNKRVLLLLDDVHEKNHMDALVGEHDWFGKGSKLIITTRNKEVLDVFGVDDCYELMGMHHDQSLQLFSKHAFRRDSPSYEYIEQSNRAIKIAGGLPLALEVIGSLLSGTKKEKWDDALNMLESVPNDKIQSKLKISYDALNFRQKCIFLDIACLFIGYDKDMLVLFWDESDFFPKAAMEVLQNMSLIKITEDNEVWMHDQVRDLGREIVRQESDMKIEKQSRVWDPKVGSDLLRKPKVKKEVQALRLNLEHQPQCRFTYEGFESLSDLRFLEVVGSRENFRAKGRLLWHESPSNVLPTNENSGLLPQLRWLSWLDIPPELNIANFFVEDLVILNLSESKFTDDWKGWSHMKVMKNLKVLNLSCCYALKRLPDELGRDLAGLEYLSLNTCASLERLPDSIGNFKSLIELDISETGIKELPDSIGKLKYLKRLNMRRSIIRRIPDALWTIEKLEEIEASPKIYGQSLHVNIGNCIWKNLSLRILKLDGEEIYSLPRLPETIVILHLRWLRMDMFPNLSNLTNLKELDLEFGSRNSDGESDGLVVYPIPQWIGNLSKLESLALRCHFVTTSPTDLSLPPHLKALHLKCPNLRRLPRLPSSLSSLHLECCLSLCSMEDLSNLKKLSFLEIWQGAITEIPGLGCLENLRGLMLCGLEQVERLPDLSSLNKLRSLQVRYCDNLVEIQGELPWSLGTLVIQSCRSLRKLPDTSSLMDKQVLEISNCNELNVEAILGCARKNPRDLQIVGFDQLEILYDLSNLRKSNELRRLQVAYCRNLVEIQGELPESLEILEIDSCESLLKLPDLSSLMELREICIGECGNLVEIQCELPKSLEKLEIYFCKSLQKLPIMSSLMGLREFCIGECGSLVEIQGKLPQSLEKLEIRSCGSLRDLPNLSSLLGLREVCIEKCGNLVEIQGKLPQSLEKLEIRSCGSLRDLPCLSSLLRLREVCIEKCGDLVEIQGELPQSLKVLKISFCKSLQKLPNLSSLKELRKVEIDCCTKLNMQAIPSLCLEKSVESEGEDAKSESQQREKTTNLNLREKMPNLKSECEYEGEDEEWESKGEDYEWESEGEDEE